MLDELEVANLGILAEARIEPGEGLVVVSGETGAGKTLLLGALRLLMGETARRDQVGPAGNEARASGRFVVESEELVISRRVAAEGRSRAYLDAQMVPAQQLQAQTSGLAEIVAQHDHLTIGSEAGIRELIDSALDKQGRLALDSYQTAWETLVEVEAEAEAIGGDKRALERELDMVRFQAEEISAAGFVPDEDVELQTAATRLRNHEAIAEALGAAETALNVDSGAASSFDVALSELHRLARLDPSQEALAAHGDELAVSISELAREVSDAVGSLDHEPGRLDSVENRLALLSDLKRKYGDGLADVIAFGERAAARAAELETLLGMSDDIETRTASATAAVVDAGAALTKHRMMAAEAIGRRATEHLKELGFSTPTIDLAFSDAKPNQSGTDRIQLLFASDASLTPGPASRIASGGELSRLVLALRLSSDAGHAPVIAFDEIDAGVGGSTALAMGRKLARLSKGRQVLCVTHLPQVAAFADRHFVVERRGATAVVEKVEGDKRLEELARMLAGMPESERGIAHAEELLRQAKTV
ncbi:MAG: DNA repair protein RecN [Acidimicrobiia bacterium]